MLPARGLWRLAAPLHHPPAPMEDIGAPEGLGPYSPRSLSRLAQGAHGRGRARGDVTPSAAGRARRGASPRHGRCRSSAALRPGPLRPRAAHPPLWEPGEPARRAPAGTNFERAPSCLHRRAHSPSPAPPDTPTGVISCRNWAAAAAALFRILPPEPASARRPAPLPVLAFGPSALPPPARRCGPGERAGWEAPVPWIPPNPRLDSRCAPKGTSFTQRFSGAHPLPPSPPAHTVSSHPTPSLVPPDLLPFCISAWLLSAPVLSMASFVSIRAQG